MPWKDDMILRGELFSIERLELHAASLAAAQTVRVERGLRTPLRSRLQDNEAALLRAYRSTALAVANGQAVTPAADWLLDNYHLIEAQISEIRADLPSGYYRQLPKLADGPLASLPRVLGLAWAFVAHTDSHFDPGAMERFIAAYQRVQPLTLGELWAVSITLRIVLVENLRRAAERIVRHRVGRKAADLAADQLLGDASLAPDPDALRRCCGNSGPLAPEFAAQLVLRLRDQDPHVTPARLWLEERLAAQGMSTEQLLHDEHQRQGAANVTLRNIITSMRLISDTDWSAFLERVSLVDVALRGHARYATMDFATRNLYRTAIEQLARRCGKEELQIADAAVQAAAQGAQRSEREGDPGYYLISAGSRSFRRSLCGKAPRRSDGQPLATLPRAVVYIGLICALACVLLGTVLHALDAQRTELPFLLLALLGVIPSIDAAVALVNRVITRAFSATTLPALEFVDGVPAEWRTVIAVPTLLTSLAEVAALTERLEIHYLASPGGALHFALLADWVDADFESTAEDAPLREACAAAIAVLNARYGPVDGGDRFLLLHRRRVWSSTQRRWMGWERKRGKLHELNRLLRGAGDTTFLGAGTQAPQVPGGVRFVITLDSDTRLPREAAQRLIGKLAHPLNRPLVDAVSRRVTEGYAVLQPRVTGALPLRGEGSLFQRIVSCAPGLDPYASAVSDVYQDLFSEGSYSGKGIYDVDAFEAVLGNRVPDERLLSHDLFEGTFARAGLVSDIEVVEAFPARYDVAASRQHRWARGDWQLLPWLFGRHDAAPPPGAPSRLRLIDAWKMLDNLRRTLSAPATLAALIVGWTLPGEAALIWTAFVLGLLALPPLLPVFAELIPRRAGVSARSHLRALAGDALLAVRQLGVLIVLLPHQACLMVDAILRTLYRLAISQRNLLQWVTAAQSQTARGFDLRSAYRFMSAALAVCVVSTAVIVLAGTTGRGLCIPFLLAWIASPAIAAWISRPVKTTAHEELDDDGMQTLRGIARRTWRYFESFVTAEDHALPPDNFQEDPAPVLAHRTSPTNMGLYLLSVVCAREFGWTGTRGALDALEATTDTMLRLTRHRGHFYNWYDTRDLRPLEPRYVSSVDSGNLAAHLITVASSARSWIQAPVAADAAWSGVQDALLLAKASLLDPSSSLHVGSQLRRSLESELDSSILTLRALRTGTAPPQPAARQLAGQLATLASRIRVALPEPVTAAPDDLQYWCDAACRTAEAWILDLEAPDVQRADVNRRLEALATALLTLADEMSFGFLVDPLRGLLSIGYRSEDSTLDSSCYDLLASEARLASFIGIAKGDLPSRHWQRLGRPVTAIGRGSALVSWSGSMFEYLMPSLVLRAPAESLLEQTSRLVVHRQIAYAARLGVPWGISESAFNGRDLEFTYQYSTFGVPGLGLKRGLGDNLVIAPYATVLAAMVEPRLALENLQRLDALGATGRYGLYESLDYTGTRVPTGNRYAIVRAFMAHHQGMSIVALANVLFAGLLRRRFHAVPEIQATELLLQERTPRDVSVARPRVEELLTPVHPLDAPPAQIQRMYKGREATPEVQLLSNGRYTVMVTAAGSGYSRWSGLGVTRWTPDTTRDHTGSYIYLRDVEDGAVWSATLQPCALPTDHLHAVFSEDRAVFTHSDDRLSTTLTILVSPEDDAEVRHLSIANSGNRARDIEVTSFAELVLALPADDDAHPAFSKMFVQTEYVASLRTLLATRRRRSPTDTEVWAAHLAVVEGEVIGGAEWETDRARFIGRGRDTQGPFAMSDGRHLTGTTGTVLDPVFALRYRLRIPPGGTACIAFWTAVAPSRQLLLNLVDKHRDPAAFIRAGTLAWTQAQVQLLHLGVTTADTTLFQRLAAHILYPNATLRPSSETILRGSGELSGLWSQGISGDRPIVLLRIDEVEDLGIVRQLLRAHQYWQMKSLAVDLVIVNERAASYVQDLQSALETAVRMSAARGVPVSVAERGAVFVLRRDMMPAPLDALLASVARVALVARRGSLTDQLERSRSAAPAPRITRDLAPWPSASDAVPSGPEPASLAFFNGLGGFTADGREYVTLLGPGLVTPAPWINVIANPRFGFQISAEGSGSTWSLNSREHRLTPWSNDPVSDLPGEALYLRDEDTGEVWSPTVSPVRDPAAFYCAAHGQGYSRFEHESHGLAVTLLVFVPLEDPVKITRVTLRNRSGRPRRIMVTTYAEWVLGATRALCAPYVTTRFDPVTGALLAQNRRDAEFASRIAFLDMAGTQTGGTADRTEFLGRHGSLASPAALLRLDGLSQRAGAGLDPCGVLQTFVALQPMGHAKVTVFLGEADTLPAAQALLARYRAANLDAVLREVTAYWDRILGALQVSTPDAAMDILLNRWTLYQAQACRMWARSAFYQSSGAYGFRDQLQDAMALAGANPQLSRAHVLRAAGRQFPQGDVQHWWLPGTGQGVRTRIADDRVWLAHATAHYVDVSGDIEILNESVAFIEGRALTPDEHDAFYQPSDLGKGATLFEHCARGLDLSLAVGSHGLPLIGTGDWNDGMNRVGAQGVAKACGSAGFCTPRCGASPRWPAHAVTPQGTRRGSPMPHSCRSHWNATAGMARGIGAGVSTTAPHWVQPAATSVVSIRSRSPGPCSPVPLRRSVRCRPSTPRSVCSCSARTDCRCCLRRRSITPCSIRAT